VEIHTGRYADEANEENRGREFMRIVRAIRLALRLKLRVNIGHGLNYQNVLPFREVPGIEDYSIGHSIISRAVLVGLDRAVREMKDLIL
jgi:pyridoxine 5-phosphate synthase